MNNQYKYGDCIPISENAYIQLKRKGYNPVLVAGYIIPNDEDFYYEYNSSAKNCKIDHTWIICGKHLIDLTKNQFNIYQGIYKYQRLYYYKISNNGQKIIIRKSLKEIMKIKI